MLNIPMSVKVLAMDRVNSVLQDMIEIAEQNLERDMALEIASIKFEINKRFHERHKDGMAPTLRGCSGRSESPASTASII
jgi:hypothetical protein